MTYSWSLLIIRDSYFIIIFFNPFSRVQVWVGEATLFSNIHEGKEKNFILIRVDIKLRTCGKQLRAKGIFVVAVLTVDISKNKRNGENFHESTGKFIYIAASMSF